MKLNPVKVLHVENEFFMEGVSHSGHAFIALASGHAF